MANIVWAKQAGNWTTASIWAFWNETTQQIEDYGQTPQVDDIVYSNSYNITISNNTQIEVSKLTNELNPYTNLAGGMFTMGTNCIVTANVCAYSGSLFYFTNIGGSFTLIGDVETSQIDTNSQVIYLNTYSSLIQINIVGNIFVNAGCLGGAVQQFDCCTYLSIIGNVTCVNGNAFNRGCPRVTSINGNLTINNASFFNFSTNNNNNYVNGNIYYNSPLSLQTARATNKLTVNGNLYATSKNPFLNVAELVFENDNWEWCYIGEGDPIFIILPYPSQPNVFPNENDVKKDVVYAYGVKIGKLEPVTVDSRNTINVYPYAKRVI